MNDRERYVKTLLFQPVDRVPLTPGDGREKTYKRWREEGLPEGMRLLPYACEQLQIDHPCRHPAGRQEGVWDVSFRMIPTFEEKVLEHRDGHYIVQDWMGNVTEISDEYDYTYIRNAIDFVTRKWHKFPVETRADFERMKERYRIDDPARFPADLAERGQRVKDRTYPIRINISGPFWQLREWCGFEPLCMLFLDDPEFVREMCDFWREFVDATLKRLLRHVVLDSLCVNEDMAYKEKPMISPAMTREFLAPCYRQWGATLRAAGVPVFAVDSDGRIDELIPVWLECGVQACEPIEVAAGCDIVAYRERFGARMAYTGGVDKRAIAKGGTVLEREIDRVCSIMPQGGYIPGCDHGIPHDIPLANAVHFVRLLAERCGWK